MGSNDGSNRQPELSPSFAQDAFTAAELAYKKFAPPEGWQVVPPPRGLEQDFATSNCEHYVSPKGDHYIAFRGSVDRSDWANNFGQGATVYRPQYEAAAHIAEYFRDHRDTPGYDYNVTYAGHSLGGGKAQLAAEIASQKPNREGAVAEPQVCVAINAAPVHRETYEAHGCDPHKHACTTLELENTHDLLTWGRDITPTIAGSMAQSAHKDAVNFAEGAKSVATGVGSIASSAAATVSNTVASGKNALATGANTLASGANTIAQGVSSGVTSGVNAVTNTAAAITNTATSTAHAVGQGVSNTASYLKSGATSVASTIATTAAYYAPTSVYNYASSFLSASYNMAASVGNVGYNAAAQVGSTAQSIGSAGYQAAASGAAMGKNAVTSIADTASSVGSTVASGVGSVASTVGSVASGVAATASSVGSTVASTAGTVGSALGQAATGLGAAAYTVARTPDRLASAISERSSINEARLQGDRYQVKIEGAGFDRSHKDPITGHYMTSFDQNFKDGTPTMVTAEIKSISNFGTLPPLSGNDLSMFDNLRPSPQRLLQAAVQANSHPDRALELSANQRGGR